MSFLVHKNPKHIASQLRTLPQHSHKEMDVSLAEDIAQAILYEQQHTDSWADTAAQHLRNECYYRDLVIQIGLMLGESAYTSDDGVVQQDILCDKVPELVAALIARQNHEMSV